MKTKYEDNWDRYSKEWGKLKLEGKDLGVEWGTEELTLRIFEKFLRPHLASDVRAFEIGPGGGKYTALAAPLCEHLLCADVSAEMLSRTKKRLGSGANIDTLKLEGIDLGGVEDASIDLAFSIDVFVHLDLEDLYGYLRELHRILRPGGTLVLHFANFLSKQGWDRFHREADFNRAQFKQMGRINFITVEMVRQLFEQTRYAEVEFDEEISPRDFLVRAKKPEIDDARAPERAARILERTGGSGVIHDLCQRQPYAVIATSDENYVAPTEFDFDGDRRDVLYEHPPTRIGYAMTIPKGKLCGAVALHPEAQDKCSEGGVTFEIWLQQGRKLDRIFERNLDPPRKTEDRGWCDFEVDLGRHAGKVGFLVFETKVGGEKNEYNWAGWGEPAIVTK